MWKEVLDDSLLGAANGIAQLDANGKVAQNVDAAKVDGTLATSNIPTLAISKISSLQTELDAKIGNAELGVAEGVATLDATGKLVQNIAATKVDGELATTNIPTLAISKISSLQSELDAKLATKQDVIDTGLSYGDVGAKSASYSPSKTEILNTGLATNDIIPDETSLPASGNPGEMCRVSGKLYMWVA